MLEYFLAVFAAAATVVAAWLGYRTTRLNQRTRDAERRAQIAESSYQTERAIRAARDNIRSLNQRESQRLSNTLEAGDRDQLEEP